MTGSRPSSAWARIRLVQGESSSGVWDVTSDTPDMRMSLGSSDTIAWRIFAEGVQPHHVELFWNGGQLWVGNAAGDFSVRVDGEPVREWLAVTSHARVEFGKAALEIEVSAPVQIPAAAKTSNAETSWERSDDQTVIQTEAPQVAESKRAGVFIETKTQLLPNDRASIPPRRVPSPPNYEEKTQLRPDLASSSTNPLITNPTHEPATHPHIAKPAPVAPPVHAPSSPNVFGTKEPVAQSADASAFAAPPPPDDEPAVKALHNLTQKLQAIRSGQSRVLPPRTLILLVAVLVMGGLAVVLTLKKRRDAQLAAAEAAAIAEQQAARPTAPVVPVHVEPNVQVSAAVHNTASADLVRQAANAVFAGRRMEALQFYRELAAREPHNEAYAVMVHTLGRQVRPCSETAGVPPCTQ